MTRYPAQTRRAGTHWRDWRAKSTSDAKFPVYCSYRGSAGPPEKVMTPATECEVELLNGGRIVSNEFKTKRKAREDVGDANGRRKRKRETFTKAAGTGMVKETIPAGAETVDVRTPRESGGEDNAQTPLLLDQERGNATEVNTAVRAAAQRTEDHSGGFGGANTIREAPANSLRSS